MARAALRENVSESARRANVTPESIYKLENGLRVRDADRIAIQQAFEAVGLTFYDNADGDMGVIVKPFTLSVEESDVVVGSLAKKTIYKLSSRTRKLGG